jgi:hypothetical protein
VFFYYHKWQAVVGFAVIDRRKLCVEIIPDGDGISLGNSKKIGLLDFQVICKANIYMICSQGSSYEPITKDKESDQSFFKRDYVAPECVVAMMGEAQVNIREHVSPHCWGPLSDAAGLISTCYAAHLPILYMSCHSFLCNLYSLKILTHLLRSSPLVSSMLFAEFQMR